MKHINYGRLNSWGYAAIAVLALTMEARGNDFEVTPPHVVASPDAARNLGIAVRVFASSRSILTVEICRRNEGVNSFMLLAIFRGQQRVFTMGADPDRETEPDFERYAFDVSHEYLGDVALDIAVSGSGTGDPPVGYALVRGFLLSVPIEMELPGRCSRHDAQAMKSP